MPKQSPSPDKSPDINLRLALSIDETCVVSGLGRTMIYEAIGSGKLAAKKAGSRTIILTEKLKTFLENLPAAEFGSGEGPSDRPA